MIRGLAIIVGGGATNCIRLRYAILDVDVLMGAGCFFVPLETLDGQLRALRGVVLASHGSRRRDALHVLTLKATQKK